VHDESPRNLAVWNILCVPTVQVAVPRSAVACSPDNRF
jgi:hypothetical protein